MLGGDLFVRGVQEYQFLHGDMRDMQMNPDDVMMPPPFLLVNFCVQALTTNGRIRMVPGKTELDWDRRTEEPAEWRHSRLFPVTHCFAMCQFCMGCQIGADHSRPDCHPLSSW